MTPRQERLKENQRIFRDANGRFEELVEERVDGRGTIPFLCECADMDCRGRIEITTGDYDAGHLDSDQYVILRGHLMVDGEQIVEDNVNYLVVEKNHG